MPFTPLAEMETVVEDYATQTYSGWQVEAISDVKLVRKMSDQLRADGITEQKLVLIGPSAFFLFWR